MTLHTLNSQNTVLNKFIAQIRDKSIQTDSMRFRRNLERIGEITAYEISKELSYTPRVVETSTMRRTRLFRPTVKVRKTVSSPLRWSISRAAT